MILRNACAALGAILLGLSMGAPLAASEGDMIVRYGDVVEPDAGLSAFLTELRANIARGEKGIRAVEKAFAPKVLTFQRSLDPLAPWNATEPISKDVLDEIADIIVEQAEMVDVNGNSVAEATDYRPEAVEIIGAMIAPGKPLGTLKEMPGAICAPAAWSFDRAAAAAFVKTHESSGSSLQFFESPVDFLKKARTGAMVKSTVPAYTLMLWDFEKDLPMDWNHYYAVNGADGYMRNRDDHQGLSQMHVCFSRIGGKYRISGIFGYGL